MRQGKGFERQCTRNHWADLISNRYPLSWVSREVETTFTNWNHGSKANEGLSKAKIIATSIGTPIGVLTVIVVIVLIYGSGYK